MPEKVDTKESARVIHMFTFSVPQEITNSGSTGFKQTVPCVEKSPKTSAYVYEQINIFLRTS